MSDFSGMDLINFLKASSRSADNFLSEDTLFPKGVISN